MKSSRTRHYEKEFESPRSASLPLVAIVGRPNVGKSTVFNRLVGRRQAIVHDQPGVTRDRHYGEAWSLGRRYLVVDTGGFDPESDDPMRRGIANQVQVAVEEADVLICIMDGAVGVTEADRLAVDLLRRSGRKVIYVANKVDSARIEQEATDLYRLGLDHLITTSALHGRSFSDLEEAIVAHLPSPVASPDEPQDVSVRVAVVGKPNAGKSSLVNRLAGQDRSLVNDQPGTTRDPVDLLVTHGDARFLFVDTAGIRKRSRVTKSKDTVEIVSVLRAMKAMEQAEVVVLICDAAEGVVEQDAKILGEAVDRGRAVIVALNKIDKLSQQEQKKAITTARDKLTFAPWTPIVRISALKGHGLNALLKKILLINKNFHQRVPTAELNRFFETVLETHPPPTQGGRAPRFFYITQAQTAPPLFAIMSSAPEAVHFSYRRYVVNQLRHRFGFEGVPIRVAYRNRHKNKKRD